MIPTDRQIHAKLYIARPDGITWVDVSDHLARVTVNLGDVSGIGTGSGVDGRVRQMEFTLRDDTANSFAPRDQTSSWNQFNAQYVPLLWPYREVELQVAITAPGIAPAAGDWKTLFTGYLGDNISCDGHTVTCACRDKAKKLQDTYIETVRQYGSEAGTPAETVIQQILDDNLGVGVVTLSCPVSPGFMVKPYQVEYQSVWDAIQQVAAQFGWYLGYIGDTLTLMEPPRTKSTADFALTAADDIYTQQLDINDADIRNVVIVTYRNKTTGQRASVTVSDATSIAEYGRRAMQIEEDDASLIDTAEEAQAFANAALADLKDLTGTTRLDTPLLPEIDVFTTISVNDERISSTVDFYAVESVQHTLDWESSKFRTEVVASGRVIGAHTRWLEMQTRPGSAGRPATPPTTNQQPATPPTITASANAGTVAISWQPLGDPLVTRYEVWRKAGNYPNDPTGAVKVAETDATIWVDTTATVGEQYTWYVRAKNVGSVTGAFTTGVVASVPAIGSSEISGDVFNLKADSDDGTGVAKPPTTGSLADLWDADLATGASWTAGPVRITFAFPTTYASDMVRIYAAGAYPFVAEALDEDAGTWTTVIASGQTAANAWTLAQFDGSKLVHSRHFRIMFNTTGAVDLRHCRFKASLVADEVLAGDISANRVRIVSGDGSFKAGPLDDGSFGVQVSSPSGSSATLKDGRLTFTAGGLSYEYVRRVVAGTAQHGQHVQLNFSNPPVVFVWTKNLAGLPYPSENLISLQWITSPDWSVGGGATLVTTPELTTDPVTADFPSGYTAYLQLALPQPHNVSRIVLTIATATEQSGYVNIQVSKDAVTWTNLQLDLFVAATPTRHIYTPNSIIRYLRIVNRFSSAITVTISNLQILTAGSLPSMIVAARNTMPEGFDAHCYAYFAGTPSATTINVTKTAANDPWTSSASDPTGKTTTTIGGDIKVTLAVNYPGFPGPRTGYIVWREELLNGDTDAVVATYNYRRDYYSGGSPAFSGTQTWSDTFSRRYMVSAGNYKWRITLLEWGGNYPVSTHSILIQTFYHVSDQIIWTGEASYVAIDGGVPV